MLNRFVRILLFLIQNCLLGLENRFLPFPVEEPGSWSEGSQLEASGRGSTGKVLETS